MAERINNCTALLKRSVTDYSCQYKIGPLKMLNFLNQWRWSLRAIRWRWRSHFTILADRWSISGTLMKIVEKEGEEDRHILIGVHARLSTASPFTHCLHVDFEFWSGYWLLFVFKTIFLIRTRTRRQLVRERERERHCRFCLFWVVRLAAERDVAETWLY